MIWMKRKRRFKTKVQCAHFLKSKYKSNIKTFIKKKNNHSFFLFYCNYVTRFKRKIDASKQYQEKRRLFTIPRYFKPNALGYGLNQVNNPQNLKGIAWKQFTNEKFRLQTYCNYPISAAQSALDLARDGFVFVGSGSDDKVTCYKCFVSKNNWLQTEAVSEVHKKISSSCAMVTGRGSDNIPIMAGTANFEELLKALHSIRTNEKLTSTLGIENTAAPFATLTQGNIIRSPSSAPTVINEAESSISSTAPDTTSHNSLSTSSDATPIGSASSASSAKVELIADSKRKDPTYLELGIIRERPKRPEYAVKGERSKTFTNWPRYHHIQADDLADAGFYYAGYGDCVRCFFCGGGLRNWEDEDDVWVEHARWFPKCAFIRQLKGQNFVDAVQELNKTNDKISILMVSETMEGSPAAFQLASKSNKDDKGPTSLESGIITDRPRRLEYALKTERIKSFSDWPRSHHSQVDDLADAGFYSAGLDTVSCYCCGGTLGNCRSRKCFLVEHARLFPRCAYLRLHVGQDFIDTVLKLSKAQNKIILKDVRDQMESSGILSHFKTSREWSKELQQKMTCKICHDKDVEVAFLPCGHLVSCAECALVSRDCPVCRKAIRGLVRAFIS